MTDQNNPSSLRCRTNSITHSDQNTINLLDVLELLAANWLFVAKVVGVTAILSAVISLSLPNVYSATSRILPPQQDSGLMGMLMGGAAGGIGSVASDILGKGSPADMYVGILKSEAVSDSIIENFKLMEIYNKKYRADTYIQLSKNVDIVAGKKDGIISISVDDKDPKLAAAMANSYVDELNNLLVKMNNTGAGQNKEFLEDRLAKAKVDLAKTEEILKAFQENNKALDVSEQAKGTIKGVADLEAQLALEEVKLSGLRRMFTDASQEIKNQQSVINSLKSQINKFEGNRSNVAILGLGAIPGVGQQYLRKMRAFKIQEALVELLTKQYEMAKFSEAKNISSLQVIQAARVPDKKSKPKRSILVLTSSLLAGITAIFFVFIREAGSRMHEEDRERLRKIFATFSWRRSPLIKG